jgi:DNA-binding PadR family transcriptional regulator
MSPLPAHIFHVLLVLHDEAMHGYGIKKAVFDASSGAIDLDAGGLYRAIARMEEQGWLEPVEAPASETDTRRKYYTLTSEGRGVLANEATRLTDLVSRPEVVALTRPAGGV